MIAGIFHLGSGLGNQLHRYVATRVLAKDKGYEFSMVAPENFKGKSFMDLDMGVEADIKYDTLHPAGKVTPLESNDSSNWFPSKIWEEKTIYYNPEFNFIEDNTIIDGDFQSERYFDHRMDEINDWLKVEPIGETVEVLKDGVVDRTCEMPSDLCVIGFRGGEYYMFSELGLPKDYFEEGIRMMKCINPKMRFEVHTDDPALAQTFFPEYKIIHDIGINWRSMRYAKYAIIANSSFYILPRLLRHNDSTFNSVKEKYTGKPVTIAPRYWARRNTKEWIFPQNFYRKFTHI